MSALPSKADVPTTLATSACRHSRYFALQIAANYSIVRLAMAPEALDRDDGATHSPLVVLEWGFWMPLTRGRIGGHDNERLAFAFTMMNDDQTVQCQISDAAMDELAEVKGTPSIARQAQFVTHRDTIEKIASELFDKVPIMKGYVVRIFSKHIQGARRIS